MHCSKLIHSQRCMYNDVCICRPSATSTCVHYLHRHRHQPLSQCTCSESQTVHAFQLQQLYIHSLILHISLIIDCYEFIDSNHGDLQIMTSEASSATCLLYSGSAISRGLPAWASFSEGGVARKWALLGEGDPRPDAGMPSARGAQR